MRKLMAIAAVTLVAVGLASAGPANTNIAVWYGTEATPLTYISGDGTIVAPKVIGCDYSTINDMDVLDSLTVYTNATVRKALVVGTTANIAGAVTMSNNATVGGTLGVTGNATFGGTLGCSGALSANSLVASNGYTGVVTNDSTLSTNLITFVNGICTAVSRNP